MAQLTNDGLPGKPTAMGEALAGVVPTGAGEVDVPGSGGTTGVVVVPGVTGAGGSGCGSGFFRLAVRPA